MAITSHRPYSVASDQIGISPPAVIGHPGGSEHNNNFSSYIPFETRLRILMIQSEICSVNIGKRAIPAPGWSYDHWMKETERRITDTKTQTENIKGTDIMAWQSMLLLHMPWARNPDPEAKSVLKCFVAAFQMSTAY